jgi:hypothetical protein
MDVDVNVNVMFTTAALQRGLGNVMNPSALVYDLCLFHPLSPEG